MQKWIGNEMASMKRKAPAGDDGDDQPSTSKVKLPGFKRGLTSFNVFCREFFQQGMTSQRRAFSRHYHEAMSRALMQFYCIRCYHL